MFYWLVGNRISKVISVVGISEHCVVTTQWMILSKTPSGLPQHPCNNQLHALKGERHTRELEDKTATKHWL